jgi:polyphenol oxidase
VSSRAEPAERLLVARVGPARVWCTGRAQGNVGDHVGDDPQAVARNRGALRARVGVDDETCWVWLRQVHGIVVHAVDGTEPSEANRQPPVADAATTTRPGFALAIVTADCAPLVVACDDAIGVVHAGHRGLAGGVIEATIASLREIGSGEVRAYLGPCIRPARYEFGADDLARFVAQFGPDVESRTRDGRPALDIPAAIRVVLDREGVVGLDDSGICTADSDAYFSYRGARDAGRQATIAVIG